jgi:hypothetical protein
MANFAPFITEGYLKDNSPIAGNMDMKDIFPYAKTAQDITIQEVLGTQLYNRLMDSLNASPKNTSTDEVELLKLCRSALVWLVPYHAMPFIWMKLRNVGLVKQGGENLQTADTTEMEKVRQECLDNATFYMNRLKDYLCDNNDLFTEYNTGCWGCQDLPPNNNRENSSDIYFDKNEEVKPNYLRFIPRP